MSPAQLRGAMLQMLREAGVDPQNPGQLLAMTAVGMASTLWRNSPLENRHATPEGPSDAEMLRLNVWMTKRLRYALATRGAMPGAVLEAATADVTTPTGATLHAVLGPVLDDYLDHVETTVVGAWRIAAEANGPAAFVLRFAAPLLLFPDDWWGTPWWPDTAEAWIASLEDDTSELWRRPDARDMRLQRPASLTSARLQMLLSCGHDLMSDAEARWFVLCTAYTGGGRAGHAKWRERQRPSGSTQLALWEPVTPGRNDRCPCGSGRKHKVCHGAA